MITLDQFGQWLGLVAVGLLLATGVELVQADVGARSAPVACASESHRPSMTRGAVKRVAGTPIQAGLVRGLASSECR